MKYETAEEMGEVAKRGEFHTVYLSILERANMGKYDCTVEGLLCIVTSNQLINLSYNVNYLYGETTISWPEPVPF